MHSRTISLSEASISSRNFLHSSAITSQPNYLGNPNYSDIGGIATDLIF